MGMIICTLVFLTIFLEWFPKTELALQDALYQQGRAVNPAIKIIAIDEKTLDALGAFETWTREPYAQLIDALNGSGYPPRLIGVDVLLVSDKGPEDERLTDVCRQYDNIVLASHLVLSSQVTEVNGKPVVDPLHIDMVEMPYGILPSLVHTGFANTVLDHRDGAVRYTLLQRAEYLSFAARSAKLLGASLPETMDESGGILIEYTSASGAYETLSMIDVLQGRIPPQAFAGSVVLVGAEAAGMGDYYPVPGGQWLYGVEIHANILQGILENRTLISANRWQNAWAVATVVFLLALVCSFAPLWLVFLLVAVAGGGHGLVAVSMRQAGVLINLLALPMGLLLILLWNIVSKYVSERLQKRKIMQAFRKYVAPQVVEEVARNHNYQLKLGGEKRPIAVLFVDIRGFTPLSEALEPEQVVEILNEYLSLVTKAIFKHGGTLDKFIGDAAMALFNAPFDSEDYVFKAVCTAREIAAGSQQLSKRCMERFGRTVSYGIGVNCGEAVVGNIGSDFRMDYTAIGDTVNTAARLESNAKPGQILISQQVYAALGSRIEATPLGAIPLKGKAKDVNVYLLDGVKEEG